MKLLHNTIAFFLAAAATTPATAVDNPCPFCPGGITLEGSPMAAFFDEMELAEAVAGCEAYVESTKAFEADSEECSMFLQTEQECCPTPHENPCQFCPEGIDVEGSPMAGFFGEAELVEMIASCEYYVVVATVLEKDSEECSMYLQMESSCCSPTPHENPCQFCPEGIDVEGSPYASFMNETELAETVTGCELYNSIAEVYEADSEECSLYSMGEQTCCPGQIEPPDNPCPFCQGGIDIEGSPVAGFLSEEELAETVTSCEYLVDLAKVLEADSKECSWYLESEQTCCPAEVENPCTICAGATIDTSITIPDMGDCNAVIGMASATMSADGMECPFFQLFEAICCPTQATIPCSICPEGNTINGGAFIMGESGPTCSDVLTNTEEGSPACLAAKDEAEDLISTCCVQAGVNVTVPSSGNATDGMTTSPVNDTPDDSSKATLSPVASPVNKTTVPADNATLSPVASPPADETPPPSPVPTDGPPTSAASSLLTSNVVIGPMTGILFVLAGFLLA